MMYAILGAGKQARGAIDYFDRAGYKLANITVVDKDLQQAMALAADYPGVTAAQLDAKNSKACVKFLENYDFAFNALPYGFALEITKAAIIARCNLVDLGGNTAIVRQQLSLNQAAADNGVVVIPDCGLAPGLVGLLAADALENSDVTQMNSIKMYVGGLPREKSNSGPLQYGNFFSFEGLVNEYTQPVTVIRDGEIRQIDPLTDYEEVFINDGFFITLEAFSTSGGISTLPESFLGRVDNLEYKTLRFPGHLRALQLLKAIGCLDTQTFKKLLLPMLDQVIIRVDAKGETADGSQIHRRYFLQEYGHTHISAMMRCTAYPAAITLLRTAKLPAGVHRQENVIDPYRMIELLSQVGVRIKLQETITHAL